MFKQTRKKVCMVSLGCSKNLVDSEVMMGILKSADCELTSDEAASDVIIVNTCGFINDAREESIEAILDVAEHKKTGNCKKLIVTGCLAQRYKDELVKELPEVDCFIGTGEYNKIGEAIKDDFNERLLVGIPKYVHDYDTPRVLSTPSYYAYVKVAEGCSNHCTYCAIPAIRGEFRSRPLESVLKEAVSLTAQGVKEINLIAQDTTSYGSGTGENLGKLLRGLIRVKGLEWIRLLYLYPGRLTDDVIAIMGNEEKVLPYVDLPLQHVNQRVLRDMNRRYTRQGVEAMIHKLRATVPGVIIRTSLIVGFPGETDAEFTELLSFVEDIRFDRLGVFAYSREKDTPAHDMKKQVSKAVKSARLDALMQAQRVISLEKNEALIGQRIRAIIESSSFDDAYALKGRAYSQAPDVDGVLLITSGKARPGDITEVTVTGADDYDIIGKIETA